MGFRFPDGIGDKYHFVPSVAKRSKTHSSTATQATQHLQQHEDSRSGSSLGVQLYMRQVTAKSAGGPRRGHRPGLNIRNSTVYQLIIARKIPTFRLVT